MNQKNFINYSLSRAYIRVCMYVCIFVCIYLFMYLCMYIYGEKENLIFFRQRISPETKRIKKNKKKKCNEINENKMNSSC